MVTRSSVYICIATAQNTINALPFILRNENSTLTGLGRYRINDFKQIKIISSTRAIKAGWFDNLKQFFINSGMNPLDIHKYELIEKDNLPKNFKDLITDFVNDTRVDKIVINIGGGTKSMSLQLYEIAKEKEKESSKIQIIFPNIETLKMDVLQSNKWESYDLLSKLPLSSIFDCYGLDYYENNGTNRSSILYNTTCPIIYNDNFNDQSFRKAFYKCMNNRENVLDTLELTEEDKQKIIKQYKNINRKIIDNSVTEIKNKLLKDELPYFTYDKIKDTDINYKLQHFFDGIHSYKSQTVESEFKGIANDNSCDDFNLINKKEIKCSSYVENIVYQRVKNHNLITDREVFFNLTKKDYFEFDILLNNWNGQLISLEAKTSPFDRKKILSRKQDMFQHSGIYGKEVIVFPYFWSDFASADKNKKGEISNAFLKQLYFMPFELHKKGAQFCILSDQKEEYYILKKDNNVERVETDCLSKLPDDEKTNLIYIQSLDLFLDRELKQDEK